MSSVLLALGIWLTRPRVTTSKLSEVNQTGVLQLAWLLGNAPDVATRMADNVTESNPGVVHLLRAGTMVTLNPRDALPSGDKLNARGKSNPRKNTLGGDQVTLAETQAGPAEQKLRRKSTV